MKKVILGILTLLIVIVVAIAVFIGPSLNRLLSSSVERFDANLTIFLGSGGNSIVLKSGDNTEILVVDTKMAGGAKKLREYVDAISDNARITVVNTHFHSDHTGGNKNYPEAQFLIGAHDRIPEENQGYNVDHILMGEERILSIGSETVHVRSMGRGHTWNDVIVYLKNRKLLVTGDLIFNGWHPALLKADGCSVQEWTHALTRLIQDFDVQVLVPGHGPNSDRQSLLNQRDYFVSIGEAIGDDVRLEGLKEKYMDYATLPMTSGFEKTIQFIEKEREIE